MLPKRTVRLSQLALQFRYPIFLKRYLILVLCNQNAGAVTLTLSVLQSLLALLCLPPPHLHLPAVLSGLRCCPEVRIAEGLVEFFDAAAQLSVFGEEVDVVAGEGEFDAFALEGAALADLKFLQTALGVDEMLGLGGRGVQIGQLLDDGVVHDFFLCHIGRASEGFPSGAAVSVNPSALYLPS